MATTISTAARNAGCAAITALIDAGDSAGTLVIRDGTTVLVTITLQDPAFGAPSDGTADLAGVPLSNQASGSGDADNYQFLDSDGTLVISGDVAQGDPQSPDPLTITLDNTNIAQGQTVVINSYQFTVPATTS